MFASASPSEARGGRSGDVPAYVRAESKVDVRFERAGSATRIADIFETGGLRLKVPNSGNGCEAVLINTAGGMTGGDTSQLSCVAGRNSKLRITTQSAEKIYRAEFDPALVSVELKLEERASLAWLPQETILFDGSRLKRALNVDMPTSATLLVVEMTVFGRVARKELMTNGCFADRWRVRREGKLVFAEDVRLDGDIGAVMQKAAVGAGAAAIATLLYVAPNAEARLNSLRATLGEAQSDCGASAWNGMLVARFAAPDPMHVRRDVARALERVSRADVPRIWSV